MEEGQSEKTCATAPPRRRRKVPFGEKEHYEHPSLTNETLPFAVWDCARAKTTTHPVYGPVAEWDTSEVTVMNSLFRGMRFVRPPVDANCPDVILGLDISCWDTSNVRSTRFMFYSCTCGPVDLSRWDVSQVRTMQAMFSRANVALVTGLEHWKTSSLTDTSEMFRSAVGFCQDVTRFDTSGVTTMAGMFHGMELVSSFRARPVSLARWVTRRVTDMSKMFQGTLISEWDISEWDTASLRDMSDMLCSAKNFRSDLSRWSVNEVTDMTRAFKSASSFSSDISQWSVGRVTSIEETFFRAFSFTCDLSHWDVTSVVDAREAFAYCPLLCDLSRWRLTAVSGRPYVGMMFFATEKSLGPVPPVWDVDAGAWTPESLWCHREHLASDGVAATIEAHRLAWTRRRWKALRDLVHVTRPAALHWLETVVASQYAPTSKRRKTEEEEVAGEMDAGFAKLCARQGACA
jgi:hypothetical protein